MEYYYVPLDEWSQYLCTTVLPWGKYKYLYLPMGISLAPDIFQQVMVDLLGDLEFIHVYIDDVAKQHLAAMNILDLVLLTDSLLPDELWPCIVHECRCMYQNSPSAD